MSYPPHNHTEFTASSAKTSNSANKEYSRAVDCGSGHLFCWLVAVRSHVTSLEVMRGHVKLFAVNKGPLLMLILYNINVIPDNIEKNHSIYLQNIVNKYDKSELIIGVDLLEQLKVNNCISTATT